MTKWTDAQDAYYDALSYITSKSSNAPRVRYDKIEYRGVTVKNVIFNDPATIVLWSDGTKTVVKCQEGDVYDPEKGLAMAISKKALGNKGNFNEVFKKWLPDEESLYPKLVAPRGMNSGLADAMITAFERMLSNKEAKGNVEG